MGALRSPDRFAAARAIADAVLYEGYVLYPYRASARKNQLRWQFGVLVPERQAALDGSERSSMRTECIVDPGESPHLRVRVRCLQAVRRTIDAAVDGEFVPAEAVDVDGVPWVSWDEAIEHESELEAMPLLPSSSAHRTTTIELPAGGSVERLRCADGRLVGRAVRIRQAVQARVSIDSSWADGPGAYLRVSVTIDNVTDWASSDASRDEVVRRSLASVHVLLAVDDGEFISLLEPAEAAAEAVAGCRNEGAFPVLVGAAGDLMLCSPIILYDQPEIAPESAGDLFDSTEIDEILALRVLTLTGEEKAEARGTDARAAEILDRIDDLPPEVWTRMHGAVRSITPAADTPAAVAETPWWDPDAEAQIDPWTEAAFVDGIAIAAGSKVVLRPGDRRADAHDLFLAGMAATVAGVFRDAEGDVHLAVTVDDDPANEELAWQGRYLYFHPDEVEPVSRDMNVEHGCERASASERVANRGLRGRGTQ